LLRQRGDHAAARRRISRMEDGGLPTSQEIRER